ncbi:germ cell nuclear acidic protein-like [Lineus longissimus]|uniref:germ cell nuclear acidic protein-like n=1 Tax=Lineus longissimus TaxID=88925 RepID=UPI002B4DBE2D
MMSFLSNGSPVVQSGSYTELIKSGNKQMTPDPKQVKKGLSTSTPVGENQKKMYETISAESPALKQNVFTDMSPALAKHSPLCREVVKRVTDRSPCSSSTRTPCNTKDKKPMFESPMLLKNGSGSPVVSRNSPKPTGSPMVLKNTSKTAGSCLVTAKEGPKPTRSPMVISRDSPRIAARDSPRKNGYPMVLRESPRKTGSPMVLRDSPRKTGSPMVLRESPRKTGSPMVLRESPRKTGSPMVLRDSPRKTGSPMVLRDSPRKTGSPIVTARDSPKLAGSPMQLKVSTKKIEKVILVNRMESSGNCEEMQTSTDEDGFVETVEGSSEEKNLQISFPSLDESSKVNEDSDSSGQNHSKEISEEINEGSVGESPSLNKSSESNETDRSSVVESLSLDNSSRLNEVSSVVDMSHDSIVCVAEKSLQVSFASEDDSKEGDVCPMDDVCLKLDDCSMVDVCDEICQVSMSSCAGSQEGSENHETVINKAGTSKLEMSGCLDLENSVSASPSSVKIEQTEVNITDKSVQVSFSSPGSDQPASWDSEKSASEDSCQSEESEKKSEESAESNQSVEDGSVVTQIQNKPGKTKHSDPQSTLDTTVYEDALTSQLTGRKSTQSWRSQPALSSDEDAPDPNPHRRTSRKSKKQATAALAKVFNTSSSDDLDDFFNKMKTPAKKQSESDDDDDLSDFVVSDGEMSFETADESPEDDEVFYINTGRLIEEAESVRKPPKKTPGAILTGKKSTKPLNTSKRKKALYNDGLSPLGDFRRTRPVPTMQQNLFCEEPSDDDVRSRKKQAAASFVDMNGESDDNLDEFKTPCPPPKVKPSRKTTASKPNYIKLSSDDDEVDEDFKTPALPPKDKPSRTTKNPKAKYIDLSSDSDDMEDFKTPGFLPPLKSDSAPNLPKAGTNTPAFRMPAAVKMKGAKTVATMRYGITTDKKPTATFLRSLSLDVQSDRRHPEAHKFVTNFKSTKEVLTKKLFDLYSSTVFENKLPDFPIIWNSRLTKTAGYCAYSRERPTMVFKCRIELSVKVCDSAERLRDTLIHEMCHAAVWLLNGKKDGHGPIWKTWAQRANMVHSELPIIRRCHSYSVETKYIYKCSKCGYQIGRHSKSLDTAGKVCGYCRGHFELYVNGKNGLKKALGSTTKTPNKFAMFVKENYGSIKSSNQKSKHKDIMKLLSSEFAKTKISFS